VLKQIESIKEQARRAVAGEADDGTPSSFATDRLAVDLARVDLKRRHSGPNERKAVGPVIAVPGEKPHPVAVAARQHLVAVMLDFVQPAIARGR
jgi:hypothetical protein